MALARLEDPQVRPARADDLPASYAVVLSEKINDGALAQINVSMPMDRVIHRTITALEDEMGRRFPLIHPPVRHVFSDGSYLREMTIPAGTLLTSMIHREQHLVVVSGGAIEVFTPGIGSETITAPTSFVSQPGTRRVGFAYEDTVWSTIHPNPENETDLDKLEDRLYWTRDQIGFSTEDVGKIDEKLLLSLLPENRAAEAEVE